MAVVVVLSVGACTGGSGPSAVSDGGDVGVPCPVGSDDLTEVLGWEFGPVDVSRVAGADAGGSDADFVYVECSASVDDDHADAEATESSGDEDAHVLVVANYGYDAEPRAGASDDCHGVETADGDWAPAGMEVAGLTDLLGTTQDLTDVNAEYAAFRALSGCLETAPDLSVIVRQVVGDQADLVSEDDLATLLGMVVDALPQDREGLRELGVTAG